MNFIPSAIVADEDPAAASRIIKTISEKRPGWPTVSVNNAEHLRAYLRGLARLKLSGQPLTSILFLSLTLPRLAALEILGWLRFQPLLKSLLVAAMCAGAQIPESEESRFSAHALIKKNCSNAQLLQLMLAAEWQWLAPAESSIAPSHTLALRPISSLRTQLDTASTPLSSDLVLLTNSPPVSS